MVPLADPHRSILDIRKRHDLPRQAFVLGSTIG